MGDLMPSSAVNPEARCRECGQEITPSLAKLSAYCIPCLEKAMDELSEADIKGAMDDLVARSQEPQP